MTAPGIALVVLFGGLVISAILSNLKKGNKKKDDKE